MVKKVDRVISCVSLCVYAERKIQMQANAWNLIMIRAGSFFLPMYAFTLESVAIAHTMQ